MRPKKFGQQDRSHKYSEAPQNSNNSVILERSEESPERRTGTRLPTFLTGSLQGEKGLLGSRTTRW
jgi:hypothetical protein